MGDRVRFESDRCLACECATPPELSCRRRVCEAEIPEVPADASCEVEYDEEETVEGSSNSVLLVVE